jgi:glycerophosphoryl diester phosphodiesterase
VLHDPTLDRTTDCSGAVAEQTLAAIKACHAGWPTYRGERVPTLGEAIALVAGSPAKLLLDCKSAPIDAVLQEVRADHAEARVILGLRSPGEVARARAALPGVTILAFMPRIGDGPAFTQAGADILRLWSDWVEADSALVDRTARLGPQVWIMVGRRLPSTPAEWKALHGRMIATGAKGLITDRPDLISAP